jgi:hypothetical protein
LETFKIESSSTTTLTQVWRFHSGWKLWCEWSVVGSFFCWCLTPRWFSLHLLFILYSFPRTFFIWHDKKTLYRIG